MCGLRGARPQRCSSPRFSSSISATGEEGQVTVSDDWMQGRATFGGLVAAVGNEAMRKLVPRDRPLRSLQTTFIGPANRRHLAHASTGTASGSSGDAGSVRSARWRSSGRRCKSAFMAWIASRRCSSNPLLSTHRARSRRSTRFVTRPDRIRRRSFSTSRCAGHRAPSPLPARARRPRYSFVIAIRHR